MASARARGGNAGASACASLVVVLLFARRCFAASSEAAGAQAADKQPLRKRQVTIAASEIKPGVPEAASSTSSKTSSNDEDFRTPVHEVPFVLSDYSESMETAYHLCGGFVQGRGASGIAIQCPQEWCEKQLPHRISEVQFTTGLDNLPRHRFAMQHGCIVKILLVQTEPTRASREASLKWIDNESLKHDNRAQPEEFTADDKFMAQKDYTSRYDCQLTNRIAGHWGGALRRKDIARLLQPRTGFASDEETPPASRGRASQVKTGAKSKTSKANADHPTTARAKSPRKPTKTTIPKTGHRPQRPRKEWKRETKTRRQLFPTLAGERKPFETAPTETAAKHPFTPPPRNTICLCHTRIFPCAHLPTRQADSNPTHRAPARALPTRSAKAGDSDCVARFLGRLRARSEPVPWSYQPVRTVCVCA